MAFVILSSKKLAKRSPLEKAFEAVSKLDFWQASKIDKAFEETCVVDAFLPKKPLKKSH